MKKFILTENQIKILKEHINQLQIPFEEFGDKYGKESYDYYMDYIEEVSEKGTLPPSNITLHDIEKYILNNGILNDVLEQYIDEGADLWDYGIDEFIQNHPECFDTSMPQDDDDIDKLDSYDILHHFTRNGIYKYFSKHFGFIYPKYLNEMEFNENGLIYIERVISIPFSPKDEKLPYASNKLKAYTEMKSNYKHFGCHWSFQKGGADDFSYSQDFYKKVDSLIFNGFVNPNDIDWVETIVNWINYSEEHELTLKNNAQVQINEIEWLHKYVKLPLQQPIIVKT